MGWFALTAWIGAYMAHETGHRWAMAGLVAAGTWFGGVDMTAQILARVAGDVAEAVGAVSAQPPR